MLRPSRPPWANCEPRERLATRGLRRRDAVEGDAPRRRGTIGLPRTSVVTTLVRGFVASAAVCLVAQSGLARPARSQGAPSGGLSEQDLQVLLPYRMGADELPAGFEIYDETAT